MHCVGCISSQFSATTHFSRSPSSPPILTLSTLPSFLAHRGNLRHGYALHLSLVRNLIRGPWSPHPEVRNGWARKASLAFFFFAGGHLFSLSAAPSPPPTPHVLVLAPSFAVANLYLLNTPYLALLTRFDASVDTKLLLKTTRVSFSSVYVTSSTYGSIRCFTTSIRTVLRLATN